MFSRALAMRSLTVVLGTPAEYGRPAKLPGHEVRGHVRRHRVRLVASGRHRHRRGRRGRRVRLVVDRRARRRPIGLRVAVPVRPERQDGRRGGGVRPARPADLADVVAAHTERIKLATGVLVLPQRNVVVTAKEIATLDHLSGGRVALGIGVGWLAEEFAALGVPFKERGARMDEYIDVLRELWSPANDPEKSTVGGRFVSLRGLHHAAAPDQRDRAARDRRPLGGGGQAAGRRGDGFFPGGGTIDELDGDVRHRARRGRGRRARPRRDRALQRRRAAGTEARRPHRAARRDRRHPHGRRRRHLPDELPGIGEDLVSRFGP